MLTLVEPWRDFAARGEICSTGWRRRSSIIHPLPLLFFSNSLFSSSFPSQTFLLLPLISCFNTIKEDHIPYLCKLVCHPLLYSLFVSSCSFAFLFLSSSSYILVLVTCFTRNVFFQVSPSQWLIPLHRMRTEWRWSPLWTKHRLSSPEPGRSQLSAACIAESLL